MMNHLSKDNIQGHFTRKLFFVTVFMLGQITILVRNYMYYPSCRNGLDSEYTPLIVGNGLLDSSGWDICSISLATNYPFLLLGVSKKMILNFFSYS